MIDALFTGVYSKFNTGTNDFKTAVNGQLYAYEVPASATYPFATFELVNNLPTYSFDNHYESALIQFRCFDNTESSAATITSTTKKLWALFDDATITITGYTNILFRRGQTRMFKEPSDPKVWISVTEYEVINA